MGTEQIEPLDLGESAIPGISEVKEEFPGVKDLESATKAVEANQTLANKYREKAKEASGDNQTRLNLSAEFFEIKSKVAQQVLVDHFTPKTMSGKGTRRKRHSGKKWTSSGTRKRSSMSASKARRARK